MMVQQEKEMLAQQQGAQQVSEGRLLSLAMQHRMGDTDMYL